MQNATSSEVVKIEVPTWIASGKELLRQTGKDLFFFPVYTVTREELRAIYEAIGQALSDEKHL